MPLGAKLGRAFHSLATPYVKGCVKGSKCPREVKLFGYLIDALCSVSGYHVSKIHGNRSHVIYTETMGWFTANPRCELGDVCIIAFSPAKKKARLVIVQNKVAKKSRSIASSGQKILASLVQHELLSTRPLIRFCSAPPKHWNSLIMTKRYPSVCIYGNFFQSGTGDADMSAITANCFTLTPFLPPNRKKYPKNTISYSGLYETLHRKSPAGDFVAAENLVDFGDLLEDLYIGKPIDSSMQGYIVTQLVGRGDPAFANLLREFQEIDLSFSSNDIPISNYPADLGNPLDFCRALLLLNVDCEEPEGFITQKLTLQA